jgi:hypothetical protein
MPKEQKIPTPAERPDLYDDFDYPERPEGYKHGMRIPQSVLDGLAKKAVAAE